MEKSSKIQKEEKKIKKDKKKIKRDVAKVLNKNQMVRGQLLGMNPYLQTLLDPFNVHGSRIPDLVMYPSAPVSVVHRATVTTNSNGVAGAVYGLAFYGAPGIQSGSLVPIRTVGPDGTSTKFPVGCKLSTNATTSSIAYIASAAEATANWFEYQSWTAGNQQLPDTFSKFRLVSAGFNIQYTGTQLDSKGKITIVACPRNTIRQYLSTVSPNLSIDYLASLPGARTIPVNLLTGGTTLYKPLDSKSLEYCDIDYNLSPSGSQVEWANTLAQYTGGEFFLVVDGATVGTNFQITAVLNFEAIPKLSSANIIENSPSPSDPIALSHAINVVQHTPSVLASSKEELGVASGKTPLPASNETKVHSPADQPSMFDKILGGIGEFVDGSTKVIDKVSPLASKIMKMVPSIAGLLL